MHWAIKKENLVVYLIWQIFVIRQTTKKNSTPNFHLIWYKLYINISFYTLSASRIAFELSPKIGKD